MDGRNIFDHSIKDDTKTYYTIRLPLSQRKL